MKKQVSDNKDGTVSVVFYNDNNNPYGYVVFNKIINNGKVVNYELINEIALFELAKQMDKNPKEVHSMAKEELDRNNLKIGDKIEFVYNDEANRIGKIVDIVTHFSTKKNKVVETCIWIDEDDGINSYFLSEMEDIDILKIGYDHYGRHLDVGDFVQFSPKDYKGHVWGEIMYGDNNDYAIKVLYPRTLAGKAYSINDNEVIILSKCRD